VFRLAAEQAVGGRFAERLGDIDVVPVAQLVVRRGGHGVPAGGLAMRLFRQVQQPLLAGEVVKPLDGVELVATAHARPITQ